jgi:hypothetical protein
MQRTVAYTSLVRRRYRSEWQVVVAGAVLALVTACALAYLLYGLITSALGWIDARHGDLQGDYPRTFQTDGLLSARRLPPQPVHILVQNLQGRVWMVLLPEDNSGRVVAIKGPQLLGPGEDQVQATVALRDTSYDGGVDLVLRAGGHTFVYVPNGPNGTFTLQSKRQGG